MALALTLLTSAFSQTNAGSYVTASVTPSANALILLAVKSRASALMGYGATPVAGNGLTWVSVAEITYQTVAVPLERLTIFRAMSASPSAGTITITFAGTMSHCAYAVVQVTGTDTTGTNGSGAIVQSATNRADNVASLLVTLGSAITSGNGMFAAFGSSGATEAQTPDTGYTELSDDAGLGTASDSGALQTQYHLTPPDNSVQASSASATAERGGIALEIKVAASGTTVTPGTGALTATGCVPTVTVSNNQTVAAGVGALTVTGCVPTVVASNHQVVAPATGVLTVTGCVPTVAVGVRLSAGVGALTLTGLAPTVQVSSNQVVAAGVGAGSYTGLAPTVAVSNNKTVAAGVGVGTYTGLAPSVAVGVRIAAGLGAGAYTGFSPTVTTTNHQTVTPGVGQGTLAGFAPTVQSGNQVTVTPGTGVLTAAGFAPVVRISVFVAPGTGVLVATGFAPTIVTPVRVLPSAGSLVATGFAPVVAVSGTVVELVRIDVLEQIDAPASVLTVEAPVWLAAVDLPATVVPTTLPATVTTVDAPARIIPQT